MKLERTAGDPLVRHADSCFVRNLSQHIQLFRSSQWHIQALVRCVQGFLGLVGANRPGGGASPTQICPYLRIVLRPTCYCRRLDTPHHQHELPVCYPNIYMRTRLMKSCTDVLVHASRFFSLTYEALHASGAFGEGHLVE